MSHTLEYDSDADCITLRIEGIVTLDLIAEIAPEVGRLCVDTGCCRLLNDMRDTTINISITELNKSPKIMDESGVSRTLKRALVVPSSFNQYRFLENVTRNRGHNFMVFKDIKKAKKWLMDK